MIGTPENVHILMRFSDKLHDVDDTVKLHQVWRLFSRRKYYCYYLIPHGTIHIG